MLNSYLEEAFAALTGAHTVVLTGRIVTTHSTGTLSRAGASGRRWQALSQKLRARAHAKRAERQASQLIHVQGVHV